MAPIETKNTTTFAEKDYDVSMNCCLWCSLIWIHYGAAPYTTKLHLGTEEVTKNDVNLCGKSESKFPYGELGSVGRSNFCCCICLDSAFGQISPGCGCDADLVDELVKELKDRQRGRGDTGQIQRGEQTLQRLDEIESKLDKILDHLQIERT